MTFALVRKSWRLLRFSRGRYFRTSMLLPADGLFYLSGQKRTLLTNHFFRFLSPMSALPTLLTEIDQLISQFNAVRFLDNDRVRQAIELEYTYESNRIEGNTLTLRETDLVINEGLTIGGKPLKDHLEAINHRDAIDYVKAIVQQRIDFSQRVLLDLHSLILRGIDRDNAGRYRSVPVLIRGSQFVPPQPYLVPVQMEALFYWYETEAHQRHPVVVAAELHERIVTIHPFIDGNGRTARLVMNLTLLKQGYPLAILKGDADSRLMYYMALETAQTTGDKSDFIQLVAETVRTTLKRLLDLLQPNN